ncbi:hypothetical protein HMPREF1624_01395 [Sporothrix schenckii ATCC 58251]|uniref:Uncharacterized protein n=1 Tax=Sporothrix schenckii (strain ATCC 58251 / de Perez 2211183) TaxID=1391915 RepID=U7Q7S4_SPOS1|nr:hypothetical protein HMPREF1624_01395 [Sporothrix schenckii ATCC 58251]
MAAIRSITLAAREEAVAHIAKRSNWAGREAGVIVVFAIVFVVGVGLIGLWIHKLLAARKAARASQK